MNRLTKSVTVPFLIFLQVYTLSLYVENLALQTPFQMGYINVMSNGYDRTPPWNRYKVSMCVAFLLISTDVYVSPFQFVHHHIINILTSRDGTVTYFGNRLTVT